VSYLDQIKGMVGEIPATYTTDMLEQSMSDGMMDIIKKVETNRREDMWMFTVQKTVGSAGLAVDSGRIMDVERGGNPCRPIPPNKRHRAAQSDSIDYATGEFPAFYNLNSKVYVLPVPDANPIEHIINDDVDTANGETTTEGFKREYELVVGGPTDTLIECNSGSSVGTPTGFQRGDQLLVKQLDSQGNTYYSGFHYAKNVLEGLTSTTIQIEKEWVGLTKVEHADYVITKPSATATIVDDFPAANMNVNSTSITSCPSIFYPQVVLWASMQVLNHRTQLIHEALPSINAPSIPISPELVNLTENLPVFEEPVPFMLPAGVVKEEIDFSSIGAQPVFKVPVAPVFETLDASDTLNIPSFGAVATLPTAPDEPSFSNGITMYDIVRSSAPTYTAPVFSLPAFPSDISTIDLSPGSAGVDDPGPAPPPPSFSSGDSDQAFKEIPLAKIPVLKAPDWQYVETQLDEEEDVELSGAKLQQIQSQIQTFNSELTRSSNEFTSELSVYQAKIQEVRENIKQQHQKENQEYTNMLAIYGNKLQKYQADVSSKLQSWQNNEINVKMAKWEKECNFALQNYQQSLSDSTNKFQQESAIYQAEIQKATADATNSLNAENTEYSSKLANYNAQVQAYTAEISKETTNYNGSIVQQAMTQFQTDRQQKLQEWQQTNGNILGEYSATVNKEFQDFTSQKEIWTQEIQKAITKYSTEKGVDVQIWQAEVNSENTRFTQEMSLKMNSFANGMQRFQQDLARVAQENRQNFEKYTAKLQGFNADIGARVQVFQGKTSQLSSEYEWLVKKYAQLKQEYLEGFAVANPDQNKKDA
tara:strand:- start:10819 stop:13269 length:2451 start_codon:yes stop_codon:yes gene_type:complete